jgi:hypothetical protein
VDVDDCVCAHFLSLLVVTALGALDVSLAVTAGCRKGKTPEGDPWLLDGTSLYATPEKLR